MKLTFFRTMGLLLSLTVFLLFSAEVTKAARQGLSLWYNSVVPALFPFMVLIGLIVSSGELETIMLPLFHILHPMLGLSSAGCFVLVSGLLCGCPMGAKICSEFVDDGQISLAEGKFLMAICNHPSPMFLLGYVYPWFADYIDISTIIISVYAPVLLLAILAKQIYHFRDFGSSIQHDPMQSSTSIRMEESIMSSIDILCKIGGYLVLFSIAIVLIHKCTLLPISIRLFLVSILEITTGIRELVQLSNWKTAYIASIATFTFGGFSGIYQVKSVLNNKKAGLSVRPYILWKSAHAILSAWLAYLLCNIN